MSPAEFRDLVSGRRRGLRAALWRGLFRVCEIPYGIAVGARNRRYDRDDSKSHRVDVPVISVGNITAGGTGKTPMVEWLARWFREQGLRVTLLSRGYGADAGSINDEALELEQKLPDVPHLQDPDRVKMAAVAIDELDCQILLLDDGFQHRRIARDLDIVLIDALEPFGFEHLLPRGFLREPLTSLKRADVVALSRADLVTQQRRREIRSRVEEAAPLVDWIEVAHQPNSLASAGGAERELESLSGRKVAAFCGLGNPAGFRSTLERCGCQIARFREFPDHFQYRRNDIEELAEWAAADLDVTDVICTDKDLVKIGVDQLGPAPLWSLRIRLEILDGESRLTDKLIPLTRRADG